MSSFDSFCTLSKQHVSTDVLCFRFDRSGFGLTAFVLVAAISTVVPAIALQSAVDAQVVGALEPSWTS